MTALDNAHRWAREAEEAAGQLAVFRAVRDDEIRSAYAEGSTIADLSRATGLTRTMLYKILERDPGR